MGGGRRACAAAENADGAPVTSSRTIAGGGGCWRLSRPRATTARFPPGASGVSPHALALTPEPSRLSPHALAAECRACEQALGLGHVSIVPVSKVLVSSKLLVSYGIHRAHVCLGWEGPIIAVLCSVRVVWRAMPFFAYLLTD